MASTNEPRSERFLPPQTEPNRQTNKPTPRPTRRPGIRQEEEEKEEEGPDAGTRDRPDPETHAQRRDTDAPPSATVKGRGRGRGVRASKHEKQPGQARGKGYAQQARQRRPPADKPNQRQPVRRNYEWKTLRMENITKGDITNVRHYSDGAVATAPYGLGPSVRLLKENPVLEHLSGNRKIIELLKVSSGSDQNSQ